MAITLLNSVPRRGTDYSSATLQNSSMPYARLVRHAKIFFGIEASDNIRAIGNGPQSVAFGLMRGFDLIGQEFLFNPCEEEVTRYVGVLSNPDALRWAISAKRNRRIDVLVVGPNVVITPKDEGEILLSDEIDRIITPSPWVSELYVSFDSSIKERLVEWPAGVDLDFWKPLERNRSKYWLIYDKSGNGGERELKGVQNFLSLRGIRHKKIVYGRYERIQYRKALRNAEAMIVISASESQGIAQFEAWACNIPTLVWDRQTWEYSGVTFKSEAVSSSPYLSTECGERFSGMHEFAKVFSSFSQKLSKYSPRKYIENHFTLSKAACAYVKLFSK